jgi:hypothetical protein
MSLLADNVYQADLADFITELIDVGIIQNKDLSSFRLCKYVFSQFAVAHESDKIKIEIEQINSTTGQIETKTDTFPAPLRDSNNKVSLKYDLCFAKTRSACIFNEFLKPRAARTDDANPRLRRSQSPAHLPVAA